MGEVKKFDSKFAEDPKTKTPSPLWNRLSSKF